MSSHNQWASCLCNELCGAGNQMGCGWLHSCPPLRLIVTLVHARTVECFGKLHILGNVNQHGSWATTARDIKSLMDHVGNLVSTAHEIVMLGDRLCHAEDIGFLEAIAPDERLSDLT